MIRARFNEMINTYGIKKLSVNFKSDKILYQSLIYSRNGTFKTSFSRALNNLSTGNSEDIIDRITGAKSSIKIDFVDDNNSVISNDCTDKFIVFSRELYEKENIQLSNYNHELMLLTIDKESKERLLQLMNDSINRIIDTLKKLLKKIGLNFEKSIYVLTGKEYTNLNFEDFDLLFKYIEEIQVEDISKINLKNLFQKAYEPIDNDNFKDAASNYVTIFNRRLNEEIFDDGFNDSNCLSFLEEINKNGYLSFDKKRGIILNGKEYYKSDDIKTVFVEAIRRVSSDPNVLFANRELVKSMGNSAEAKRLQIQFSDDPLLINQLSLGKKKIIAIALKKVFLELDEFKFIIEQTKRVYGDIILNAKEKQSDFENAIRIYKNRFNPIFDISIVNKTESLLGENVPILKFNHKSNFEVDMSESEIRNILSSGEKTALNIVGFIVEYEANKKNNPILVMDDLVETFDYANRHAFIEYINDLVINKTSVIILTHNFEFFRTLSSRIPKLDTLSAFSKNGHVYIEENRKLNFDIKRVFEINNIRQFIFAIPFLREVKSMLGEDTNILNNCLHYKEETKNLTIGSIKQVFPSIVFNDNVDNNYLKTLYEVSDSIVIDNQYDIIPKMILSIACRLKIEELIIGNDFTLIENITSNQLSQLRDKYQNELNVKMLELIDRVQISTPEFIHCNSFMYEPLVDIPGDYLLELYNDLKIFNNNDVWK